MRCTKPYIKQPIGISRTAMLLSEEARNSGTPFRCGRCSACRRYFATVWQHRLILEALAHEFTAWITLTYAPEFLPEDGNLDKEASKRFVHNLKRIYKYQTDVDLRYFAVGEYGDKFDRPHYHYILFGMNIEESKEMLEKEWPYGIIHARHFSSGRAGYITGYVKKKMTKEGDPWLKGRKPEFSHMSKQPGIGYPFLEKVLVDTVKKNPDWNGEAIFVLKHGRRHYPLGRYLSLKLSQLLGNELEYLLEVRKHSDDVFDTYHYDDSVPMFDVWDFASKDAYRVMCADRNELIFGSQRRPL